MANEPLHVAILIGSTRDGRLAPVIGNWTTEQVQKRSDFTVDVIDLLDTPLPAHFTREPNDDVAAFTQRLDASDAFIVVTPEYNHSFPAALKHAIDFGNSQWARKPVAFVSYGGASGGLRAVEQLRNVFSELRSTTLRDVISFHNPWAMFDESGSFASGESYETPTKIMLDELVWWGNTLRNGRNSPE